MSCDFTESQRLALQWGVRATSTLSFFGASAMVTTYLAFPSMRSGPMRLVAILSSVDIVVSMTYFWASLYNSDTMCLEANTPSVACQIEGLLLQFSELCAVLWTACLAHNLYQLVVKVDLNYSKYFRIYHAIVWPTALTLTLINVYNMGWNGQWCWIRPDKKWYFLSFYVPVIVCWVFACFVLFVGLRSVGKEGPLTSVEVTRKRDAVLRRRLMLILFIAFFCWSFSLANRGRELAGYDPFFPLSLAQTVTNPLAGILNALVYWQNDTVRNGCRRCCVCCRGGPEEVKLINAAQDKSQNKSLLSSPTY